MKKKSALIRIILYSILAVVLTLIMIAVIHRGFYGCTINIGGYTYKDADKYEIGEFKLDEEIYDIDIDWIAGEVKVIVTDEENVYATESSVKDEDDKLRYRVVDGKLMIKFRKSERFSMGNSTEKELLLYIPRELAGNMNNINISCVSADFEAKDIKAEEFEMEMVSGKIEMSGVTMENLNLQAVSGSSVISGSIDKINAESVSGKIEVTSDKQLLAMDVETVSGKVTINMPEGDGFSVEMDSVSGDMDIEFDVTKKEDKYIYGDGSAEYNFDSVSGDVQLNIKNN